jgi:hypothetical protein
MTIGMIVLVAVAIVIYLGAAQRVLDRLRLTDKAALLFVGAILIGGFLPDIPLSDNVSINIGGGIIPIALAGYLLAKAGTAREKIRAVLATLVTAAVVYGTMKIMPLEPTYNFFLDPMYIFAIIAGIVGYLAGRSRRSAFIAGSMGLLLTDIFARIEVAIRGGSGRMTIGGAGVFDSIQGGPSQDRPEKLRAQLSDEETAEELNSEGFRDHEKENREGNRNEE